MGFTKLDEGIVHSSIWSEALATRVLWVTMLAMADRHGFVSSSRSGLLRAANIPEVDFDVAIAVLESPDNDSRSPEYEGRRVEKCEGGWMVLNYAKYRAITPREGDPDSPGAIRTRRWRGKQSVTAPHVVTHGDVTGVTSASVLSSLSSFSSLKEEILGLWNSFAVTNGLPPIRGIAAGSKREHALNARLGEKGFDFQALLAEVARSPFLLGTKKGCDFRATFDWIIAPSNYQKIIEGNYRGTSPTDGPEEWLKQQEGKHADD